jgi:hypothetical protein
MEKQHSCCSRTNYTVFIGTGGARGADDTSKNGSPGEQSCFIDNTTVAGFGGAPAIGGSFIPVGQGGNGGDAFVVSNAPLRLKARLFIPSSSGGGGAGGYTGQGGKGGYATSNNATAGAGGAGGGGFGPGTTGAEFKSGSGGSTLLGGNVPALDGVPGAGVGAGGGGSNGCTGLFEAQDKGENAPTGAGGGANQPGGHGACRVVWGDGTSWPSNVPTLEPCAGPS